MNEADRNLAFDKLERLCEGVGIKELMIRLRRWA